MRTRQCSSPVGAGGIPAPQRARFIPSILNARWLWLAIGLFVMHPFGQAQAAPPRGSNQQRQEAIRAIPLEKMNQSVRDRLWAVVSRPSLYRRLPVETIQCDPDLHVFLVRYPEVVVNMWKLMGVSNVNVRRTGEFQLQATDGAGTFSSVELVYGTRNLHVMYADGYYEGPLFKRKLRGRCVLVLSTNYQQDAEQRPLVSNRLDVFLQLDNVGAELIAKTLQPMVGRTADYNFAESAKFLSQVSQAAEMNGEGVGKLAARLTQVDPQVRNEFARLAAVVSQRETSRTADTSEPQKLSDMIPIRTSTMEGPRTEPGGLPPFPLPRKQKMQLRR